MKTEVVGTREKENCKHCDKLYYGECWFKSEVKCHKYSKFGHFAKNYNLNKTVEQVNFAHQVEEIGNLFYASHSNEVKKTSDV